MRRGKSRQDGVGLNEGGRGEDQIVPRSEAQLDRGSRGVVPLVPGADGGDDTARVKKGPDLFLSRAARFRRVPFAGGR